jgi:hypothetical protein
MLQNNHDNNFNSTKINRTEKEIKDLEKVLDLLLEKKNYFTEAISNDLLCRCKI